jgi:hypothetical protein
MGSQEDGLHAGIVAFSRQYAAASTIAASMTPWPRSATATGGASFRRMSSRHFWKLDRKNPVLDALSVRLR